MEALFVRDSLLQEKTDNEIPWEKVDSQSSRAEISPPRATSRTLSGHSSSVPVAQIQFGEASGHCLC